MRHNRPVSKPPRRFRVVEDLPDHVCLRRERSLCGYNENMMTTDSVSPRLNPSDETIKAGQITIRFLVTGKDSNGSVAVFELRSRPARG